MEINTNNVVFGMKAITSLKQYAKTHPKKRIKIDPDKWEKANKNIKMALKGLKMERYKAQKSASETILTK